MYTDFGVEEKKMKRDLAWTVFTWSFEWLIKVMCWVVFRTVEFLDKVYINRKYVSHTRNSVTAQHNRIKSDVLDKIQNVDRGIDTV